LKPVTPRFQNLDQLSLPARPANARAQLERVLTALVRDFRAEKIIAFGSCVHGSANDDSDVDLLVVREHPPGCEQPGLEADLCVMRAHPLISTDLLVRTPAEWHAQQQAPFGVFAEIVARGVPLYER
jgi:hypothetical protein